VIEVLRDVAKTHVTDAVRLCITKSGHAVAVTFSELVSDP
jgi:hypothetical protein